MKLQISGQQIDIGDALRGHVRDSLQSTVEKYAGRPTGANVVFSRDGHRFVCESDVHLSSGMNVQSRGIADEIYAAFEAGEAKMEKQLRRYKRRLKDHHKERTTPVEFAEAGSYILAQPDDSEAEQSDATPIIVAEMETKVPTLSVGDAVMQMELAGASVQVFRNEKHGGVNVVYRREDDNIGWIDPRNIK